MRLPNKLLLFLFLLSRSNTYQLESGSEKKLHVFVEKTTKLFWQKNLERLYRRRTSLIFSQQTNCLREFRWCMHNLKDERLLVKISYTVVYCTQFIWGNNCIYNSYRSCIQKHKHIGNMHLLYFTEEVVPYLVRQSIYCILSESSRQHKKKNILIKKTAMSKNCSSLFS